MLKSQSKSRVSASGKHCCFSKIKDKSSGDWEPLMTEDKVMLGEAGHEAGGDLPVRPQRQHHLLPPRQEQAKPHPSFPAERLLPLAAREQGCTRRELSVITIEVGWNKVKGRKEWRKPSYAVRCPRVG